jgi:hypothetical protein
MAKDALAARVAKIRKEVLMKKITILMILLGLLLFFRHGPLLRMSSL